MKTLLFPLVVSCLLLTSCVHNEYNSDWRDSSYRIIVWDTPNPWRNNPPIQQEHVFPKNILNRINQPTVNKGVVSSPVVNPPTGGGNPGGSGNNGNNNGGNSGGNNGNNNGNNGNNGNSGGNGNNGNSGNNGSNGNGKK